MGQIFGCYKTGAINRPALKQYEGELPDFEGLVVRRGPDNAYGLASYQYATSSQPRVGFFISLYNIF
jgi:hypothetical protein